MHTIKAVYHPNPRLLPMTEGAVGVEGYRIDLSFGGAAEMHGRHLKENAFDVFEFSISNLFITKDMPERAHLRWQAIPIHLMRCDFFYDLHVHQGSGIRSFADLKGKTVGIPDFQMTAGVWLRIILRKLYGIQAQDISWVNGRPASQTHGEGVAQDLAPGIRLRRLQEHERLDDLLHRGEIDAAFADAISCRLTTGNGVERVPLAVTRQMCAELYAKTGLRPVNHVLLIQQALADAHPALPMQLFDAMEKSKQIAYRRMRESADTFLMFPELYLADNEAAFGADPYPSGLKANRPVIEAIREELLLERLIRNPVGIDGLFHPSTLGT